MPDMRLRNWTNQLRLPGILLLLLGQCQSTSALRHVDKHGDLFADSLDALDLVYSNQDTGMVLQFEPDWQVFAHFDTFPQSARKAAQKIRASDQAWNINGEVALIAWLPEQRLWLRVIVEEAALSLGQYHNVILKANQRVMLDAQDMSIETIQWAGREAVLWQYTGNSSGQAIRTVEYQFQYRACNLRFTYWTGLRQLPAALVRIRELMHTLRFQIVKKD
ncbi:MAG: hypothetical protein KDK39_12375 [Leptospiraceae bacterium]|nr:hypothetical protein [Leptospiraceae bacterium]